MAPVRIGRMEDFPPGSVTRVDADGRAICVARTQDGGLYAIQDECTHERYALSEGELYDHQIECPQHFSRFDLRTGEPTALPADERARTYPVTVTEGNVFLEVS